MDNKFKNIFASAIIFSLISTGCSDTSASNSNESSVSSETSITSSDEVSETEVDTTTANSSENSSSEKIQTVQLSNSSSEYVSDLTDIFSNNDLNPIYTADTEIILKGSSAEVKGNGADIKDSVITVSKGGTYKISGTLDDGQIIVNSAEKVWLILDGADIHCSTSAPIYIQSADKTFITLAENSQNTLSDGTEYNYASAEENEPDAVIFSKDNLTVNGSGTLNITANFNEGITSKDDITITGGKINVTSKGNGIKGKDCIAVTSAEINITSQADGMKSSNADESGKGFIFINDGIINITSAEDSIQAEQELIIAGGTISAVSGGGSSSENVKTHTDSMMGGGKGGFFGKFGGETMDTPAENTSDTEDSTSYKGLKAGSVIYIGGGDITVDSADDSIHSNDTAIIDGGNITLSSGDDGIHSDTKISVTGGTVNIEKSYEGIESAVIDVSDGEISLCSSDDGFNASDGSSQGAMGQSADGVTLNITGGTVYVTAEGDGLDSNGTMSLTGGTIIVNGPTNSGNGSLDSNNGIAVDGAVLIAAGSSGMAEYPDTDTSQPTLGITLDNQQGGTAFTICDSNGNEILTYQPEKNYSCIIVSTPDLSADEEYTLYTGTSSSAEQKFGLYKTGGFNNDGTETGTYTTGSYKQNNMMGGGFGGHGGGHNMIPPDSEIPENFNPENRTPPEGDFGGGKFMPPPNGMPAEFQNSDTASLT